MNNHCDKDVTYMFELCTMENRVVTHYPTDRVYLTGSIDNKEYHDSNIMDLLELFTRLTLVFDALHFPQYCEHTSINSVIEHAETLTDLQEGFVLCENGLSEDDLTFKFRLKIKSKAYLHAHRIRGNGLTPKRVFDLVYANEHIEFLVYYPEYQKFFDTYIEKYDIMKQEISGVYEKIKHLDDKKAYALEATKHVFCYFLFDMKQKHHTLEESLSGANINLLYRLMGIK
jgi:hypothetical protein